MAKLLQKWRVIIAIVVTFKLLVTVLTPPGGDLVNWADITEVILGSIVSRQFSHILVTGVYAPLGIVLVPFFWIWTQLPIQHPPISWQNYLFSESEPAFYLNLLMKIPPFLADTATGILVIRLAKRLTGSITTSRLAFLAWYINPFNIYWINAFGGMDVIPAFVFMLALTFGTQKEWARCGVCASIGTLLRIFPLFAFPFFFPAIKSKTNHQYLRLTAGFVVPLALGFIATYTLGAGTLINLVTIPQKEYWLFDFLGIDLTSNYVKLTYVIVAVQLFVTFRYWKNPNLLPLATTSLLALLTGAQAYGGTTHHFLWVCPLLAVSVALNPNELWIFTLTFVTASTVPSIIPFTPPIPFIFDTFLWGSFFAAKAAYLLKINLENIRFQD